MTTEAIPENVLAASENIHLRDLLDSPTFRPWIVSAISNAVRASFASDEPAVEDDQFLQFKMHQMMRAIPYDVRRSCFRASTAMLRERRNYINSRDQEPIQQR